METYIFTLAFSTGIVAKRRQGAIGFLANFLVEFLRAIAEFFARLSHGLGVCLSVRHTTVLYQNGPS